MNQPSFNFLSLGVGVQSSTLALMASLGEIGPMPDAAIFSDTQDEPASVYRYLAWHGYVSELIRNGRTQFQHPLTVAKWRRTTGKPTAKLAASRCKIRNP